MARIENWYKQDLKKPVPIRRMETVFNQDALGHLFGVEVYSDGEAVTLAGSVTGYCLLADGTTVPVSGTRSANKASIVIPQTAYSVIGPITITVKLTEGSAITTLLAVVGMVARSRTGQQVNPGSTVTDWTNQISAQLQAVQTAADNLGSTLAAPFSTATAYAAGTYVMYNGNLYRFTNDHVAGDWSSSEVTQVKACNEISDLKSALGQTDNVLNSLERFTRKTINKEFTTTKNVTSGSYDRSTKIIDAYVPANQEYTVRISTSAGHSNIAIYEQHTDGTYKTLTSNAPVDTDLSYTAEKETDHFNIYVLNGFTSSGTVTFTVRYVIITSGSIEERVDSVETELDEKVSVKNMEFADLVDLPQSANRINPENYLHGKEINAVYGNVTDKASGAAYILDVVPGSTIYFWRWHNNNVISGYSDGIGVYDANGNFITRGGVTGYQYSYTVPSNVYKLALNFSETFLQAGDKYMAIVNSSANPGMFIPYRDASEAYFSTENFLKNVDFNKFIPLSCRLPEDGFIKSYGHGGLSKYYPLDTAPAIIGAKKAGLSGTEIDVQITLDGVYVLYHDEDMQRVGGTQSQTIANMTYSQLQQFDYGSWFSPLFTGTELCTLDKAAQLCRELGLEIYLDCKTLDTQAKFLGAKQILDKWEMFDKSYWITGAFAVVWDAIPNAKVIFAPGSKLTGSTWDNPQLGWFESFNSGFPVDKQAYKDGMPVIPDGVYFGISQTYILKDETGYGIAGLKRESELAKERGIKYGFYAVDDVEVIADLSANIPYQQYMASNAIAYQNAMNQHYGITKADYILTI